jgi:hypothetical protein
MITAEMILIYYFKDNSSAYLDLRILSGITDKIRYSCTICLIEHMHILILNNCPVPVNLVLPYSVISH